MLSLSARVCTAVLGLTLNPMITAPDVPASMMSDSVTVPTPVWIILTLTSSLFSFSKDETKAPIEP